MATAPHISAPIKVPISHFWTASLCCDIFFSPFVSTWFAQLSKFARTSPLRGFDFANLQNALIDFAFTSRQLQFFRGDRNGYAVRQRIEDRRMRRAQLHDFLKAIVGDVSADLEIDLNALITLADVWIEIQKSVQV